VQVAATWEVPIQQLLLDNSDSIPAGVEAGRMLGDTTLTLCNIKVPGTPATQGQPSVPATAAPAPSSTPASGPGYKLQMGSYTGTVTCDAGFTVTGRGGELQTTIVMSTQPGAGGASVVLRLSAEWRGIFSWRCNYGMMSLCARDDDRQCAGGQEAWRCKVTGITTWDDTCAGQAVGRATVARVCYAGNILAAKELSPTCKRLSGDLVLKMP
jgi:hypothetical protein